MLIPVRAEDDCRERAGEAARAARRFDPARLACRARRLAARRASRPNGAARTVRGAVRTDRHRGAGGRRSDSSRAAALAALRVAVRALHPHAGSNHRRRRRGDIAVGLEVSKCRLSRYRDVFFHSLQSRITLVSSIGMAHGRD